MCTCRLEPLSVISHGPSKQVWLKEGNITRQLTDGDMADSASLFSGWSGIIHEDRDLDMSRNRDEPPTTPVEGGHSAALSIDSGERKEGRRERGRAAVGGAAAGGAGQGSAAGAVDEGGLDGWGKGMSTTNVLD